MLVVDERSHGKSKGIYLTMGIKEKYDCISWIDYVIKRNGSDTKIILNGVSMGASIVCFASSLDLPNNVIGIVADSPYSSVSGILKKVCTKDYHIPWLLVSHFIFVGALLFGHFNICKGNVLDYTKNLKVPMLIIHGEDDTFVPPYMSEDIYNTNKDLIRRITFKNADHGISFMEDKDRYIKEVITFFEECEKTTLK